MSFKRIHRPHNQRHLPLRRSPSIQPQQLQLPFRPRPADPETALRLYGTVQSYVSGFPIAFLAGDWP